MTATHTAYTSSYEPNRLHHFLAQQILLGLVSMACAGHRRRSGMPGGAKARRPVKQKRSNGRNNEDKKYYCIVGGSAFIGLQCRDQAARKCFGEYSRYRKQWFKNLAFGPEYFETGPSDFFDHGNPTMRRIFEPRRILPDQTKCPGRIKVILSPKHGTKPCGMEAGGSDRGWEKAA